MRATLNLTQTIGGMRVSSATKTRAMQQDYTSKLSKETRDLAESIPYWPQTIRIHQLMEETGLSKSSIVSRISSCHSEYLIFTHRGRLSRLMRDLSNCN